VPAPVPAKPGRFGWLTPAFAAPAMVLLLAVIGYQNLVTYPRLQQALNSPRVLPFAAVNVGTWGSSDKVISTGPEQGFMLLVRIPPDDYPRHTAELHDPAGKLEWSLPIPASSTQDQWPVQVPGAKREAGNYVLVVRGITAAGESKVVGRESFELQIQK